MIGTCDTTLVRIPPLTWQTPRLGISRLHTTLGPSDLPLFLFMEARSSPATPNLTMNLNWPTSLSLEVTLLCRSIVCILPWAEWCYQFSLPSPSLRSADRLDGSIGLTTDLPAEAATEDAKAAVRFVRKMNVSWRIDPAKVMIAGDSAGAVTALWVGYASAGRHGSSGNAGFSDEVGAVVSVSGELKSQAFCKVIVPKPFGCSLNLPNKDYVGNVTGPPQPPLVILHGTADYTVPYVNGLEVYTRAKSVGLPALLLTVPGGGHVPFDSLFNNATRMDQLMTFLDLQFAANSTCACN